MAFFTTFRKTYEMQSMLSICGEHKVTNKEKKYVHKIHRNTTISLKQIDAAKKINNKIKSV